MKDEEHIPLNPHEDTEPSGLDETCRHCAESACHRKRSKARRLVCTYAALACLLVLNILQFALSQLDGRAHGVEAPASFAKQFQLQTVYRRFWWNTAYSSKDQARQDAMWDAIRWTHGMVAVDKQTARTWNWPRTMDHPRDASKGVWLLAGYHEVHCLGLLRHTVEQAFKGSGSPPSPDEHTRAHVAHCFDQLLHNSLCSADSTPLFVTGGTKVGHGQLHACRDWEQLRDLAAENSACFSMNASIPLEDAFEDCQTGDGLYWGPATHHAGGSAGTM